MDPLYQATNSCTRIRHTPNSTSDYDTSLPLHVRRYLGTYGLVPPVVQSYEIQKQRCTFSHIDSLLVVHGRPC